MDRVWDITPKYKEYTSHRPNINNETNEQNFKNFKIIELKVNVSLFVEMYLMFGCHLISNSTFGCKKN